MTWPYLFRYNIWLKNSIWISSEIISLFEIASPIRGSSFWVGEGSSEKWKLEHASLAAGRCCLEWWQKEKGSKRSMPAALTATEENQHWMRGFISLTLSSCISESRLLSLICSPRTSAILVLNGLIYFKGYPEVITIILIFFRSSYLNIKVLIVIDIFACIAKRFTYKCFLYRKKNLNLRYKYLIPYI